MLDLAAVIVGATEKSYPQIRRELANNGVDVACEGSSFDSLIHSGRVDDGEHLFVYFVRVSADLDSLQRMSGTFVGQPILVLLEEKADSGLVFKAMRAGASQVVPMPLVSKDFKEAIDCIALQFNRARANSRVIAFTGATGGCGVTSVALNAAYEIALNYHRHTMLIECALQMGMVDTYLDLKPTYSVRDLLDFGKNLDSHAVRKAATRVADHFDVITGPPRVMSKPPSGTGDIRNIIEFARYFCEIVVLDLPPTLDERYFDILSNASQVVAIFEQKIPSVRNLQLILDVLPPSTVQNRCQLVINRYEPRLTGFAASDMCRVLNVSGIQTIAYDPGLEAAANNGRPLRLQDANSAALADIDRLNTVLIGEEHHPTPKLAPGFVNKVMRGLRLA